MTEHYTGKNPTYVTGASAYRIALTALLTPAHPQYAEMQEFFLPEHHTPDGYGLAFLESEEHSLTYVGPVEQIREYQQEAGARGRAHLDTSRGALYAFWPNGKGWDDYLPATTWNPRGEGIVTEFDHPHGGRVTVYEYLADGDDGEKVPMVGYHCEQCHPSPEIEHDAERPNRGPHDRRWTARCARVHVRHADRECRPVNPKFAEVAQQVANEHYGVNHPVTTWESHCATTGPCATIRRLRARA